MRCPPTFIAVLLLAFTGFVLLHAAYTEPPPQLHLTLPASEIRSLSVRDARLTDIATVVITTTETRSLEVFRVTGLNPDTETGNYHRPEKPDTVHVVLYTADGSRWDAQWVRHQTTREDSK